MLAYTIMSARMEAALCKEREGHAEARASLDLERASMEQRIRAAEEASRRVALDDFMRDIRIEERSYVRENNDVDSVRRTMVSQERLYFRNIPLSNWIDREAVLEEGPLTIASVPEPQIKSVFAPIAMAAQSQPVENESIRQPGNRLAVSKVLAGFVLDPGAASRPATTPHKGEVESAHEPELKLLAMAFGAQ